MCRLQFAPTGTLLLVGWAQIMLRYILCCAVLWYAMLFDMSYYITLNIILSSVVCYITPYYIKLLCRIIYYSILVMLYTMLRHVILRYL